MRARDEQPGTLVTALLDFQVQARTMLRDPHAVGEVLKEAAQQAAGEPKLRESLAPLSDLVRAHMLGSYRAVEEDDVALALAAAMYVASPWDLSPDYMPGGLVDDLQAVTWVHQRIAEPLIEFVEWSRVAAKRHRLRTMYGTSPPA